MTNSLRSLGGKETKQQQQELVDAKRAVEATQTGNTQEVQAYMAAREQELVQMKARSDGVTGDGGARPDSAGCSGEATFSLADGGDGGPG